MEREFLKYLLYITFVELREHAYEIKDQKVFWLCDLLHNIPGNMDSEEEAKVSYERLKSAVDHDGKQSWLDLRMAEFNARQHRG